MANLKKNLEVVKAFQKDYDDLIEMLDRESRLLLEIKDRDFSQVSLLLRNAISGIKDAKLYTKYAEDYLKHRV